MKLYHGSTVIVDKPLVSYGRDNLDFGKGFYTTNMQSQAEKWVQRFISLGKKGIINIYNFDNTDIEQKYRTVELYFSGLIDKETALQRLKFEKTNNQICFINQEIVDNLLYFESSYEAKGVEA